MRQYQAIAYRRSTGEIILRGGAGDMTNAVADLWSMHDRTADLGIDFCIGRPAETYDREELLRRSAWVRDAYPDLLADKEDRT